MKLSTVDYSTVPQSQRFNQKRKVLKDISPHLIFSDGEVDILSNIVTVLEPVKLVKKLFADKMQLFLLLKEF